MELEMLKKSWDALDERLHRASLFNQRLVENIISSRTTTTVEKIKRLYTAFYCVLSVEVVFLLAILFGNPFDFIYKIQFVPFFLIFIGVVIAFLNLIHIHRSINKLSPGGRIDYYLKGIVDVYVRNSRFEKWFGGIFLSVGLLTPLSFLPTKIERLGLSVALTDTAIMIIITGIMFLAAIKLGAFKNLYKEKLEKDLNEWNELKALAAGIDS